MIGKSIANSTSLACALSVCASIASAQTTKSGSIKKTSPEVQGFSVVLVLGDLDGSSTGADNVPAAARKALGDMKDFLPYKSYRLLDTAWILGAQHVTSRLRGADDVEYELTLTSSQWGPTSLRVDFRLGDATAEPTPASIAESAMLVPQKAEAEEKLAAAERELRELKAANSEKHPAVVNKTQQINEARRKLETINQSIRGKHSGAVIN